MDTCCISLPHRVYNGMLVKVVLVRVHRRSVKRVPCVDTPNEISFSDGVLKTVLLLHDSNMELILAWH